MKRDRECTDVQNSQRGKNRKILMNFFSLFYELIATFVAVTERSINPGAEDRMKISSTLNITGKKTVINISRKDISKHRSNIGFS